MSKQNMNPEDQSKQAANQKSQVSSTPAATGANVEPVKMQEPSPTVASAEQIAAATKPSAEQIAGAQKSPADPNENYPTTPQTPNAPLPEPAPTIDPEAHLQISADRKTFKGSNTEKRFPIDQKDFFIVRQVKVEAMNGGMVEVPNTESTQTYNRNVYQQLVDSNYFVDSHMKVEVLHEPIAK